MTMRYLDPKNDLEFLNPRQIPEIDARKESIVDVLVKEGMLDAARNEGRIEITKKMLESGIPIDQVMQITGLSEQTIQDLRSFSVTSPSYTQTT